MKNIGILLLSFLMVLSLTTFASAYEVYSSGPLNSVAIDFYVNNDGPGTINSVEFDLLSPYVIDTSISPVGTNPSGVTSTFFANNEIETNHYSQFGFTFTGFTLGSGLFSFNWDPDVVGNSAYGAIISELAGTQVKLNGVYLGDMVITGDHLSVAPVPVPGALLLLGTGLLSLATYGRRKSSSSS